MIFGRASRLILALAIGIAAVALAVFAGGPASADPGCRVPPTRLSAAVVLT